MARRCPNFTTIENEIAEAIDLAAIEYSKTRGWVSVRMQKPSFPVLLRPGGIIRIYRSDILEPYPLIDWRVRVNLRGELIDVLGRELLTKYIGIIFCYGTSSDGKRTLIAKGVEIKPAEDTSQPGGSWCCGLTKFHRKTTEIILGEWPLKTQGEREEQPPEQVDANQTTMSHLSLEYHQPSIVDGTMVARISASDFMGS